MLAATWAGIGGAGALAGAQATTPTVTAPAGTITAGTADWTAITGASVSGFTGSDIRVDVEATNGVVRYTGSGATDVPGLVNDATNGKAHFAIRGTEAEVNGALGTLEFKGTGGGAGTVKITATTNTIGNATYDNGHYYEVVVGGGLGGPIPFATALSGATTKAIDVGGNAINGHLVTITSDAENSFVAGLANGVAWIAASDAGHEGDWRWMAGPESGKTFYCTPEAAGTGCLVDASVDYSSWLTPAEPSNGADLTSPEDAAVTNWGGGHTGAWNDVPETSVPDQAQTDVFQYVVEYEGPSAFPAPETATATANLTVSSVPDAPTAVNASAGNGKVVVSWTAPANNGGSAITGYTVTSNPEGKTCTAAATATSCTVTGLTNGTTYTFTVTATNAVGESVASTASGDATPQNISPAYEPLPEQRLADTRTGAKPGANTTVTVPLGSSLPPGTSAALVNLTGVDADTQGHVTLYACGAPVPLASSLNVQPGLAVANLALVEIPDGATDLCALTSASANLIVDVVGAFSGFVPPGFPTGLGSLVTTAGAPYTTAPPARLFDSRLSGDTSAVPAGTVTRVPLGGPGVPADTVAVALNVTTTQAQSVGHVTAFACSEAMPPTSNLNTDPAGPTANMVVVPYTGDHDLCLYNASTTHVIVDLVGYFTGTNADGTVLVSSEHRRLLYTRTGEGGRNTPLNAGDVVVLSLGASDWGTVQTAVLNVTSTGTAANGHITVWDCSDPMPNTSSLNPKPGRNVPGLVFAHVGTGTHAGQVCLYSATPTDLVVDLQGAIVTPPAAP
jgi:hypothetical protein